MCPISGGYIFINPRVYIYIERERERELKEERGRTTSDVKKYKSLKF